MLRICLLYTSDVYKRQEHLHYNKNYLSTFIQKTMGQKFQDIVKEQRFLFAAKMIVQGDLPLKEIKDLIGYHNFSHFYENFKELFLSLIHI